MLEAGLHHTATMHSLNMERLNRMARKMKTSILLRMVRPMQGLDLVVRYDNLYNYYTYWESTTSARCFARRRRCCLTTGLIFDRW